MSDPAQGRPPQPQGQARSVHGIGLLEPTVMGTTEPHHRVAELEEEIEKLAGAAERCRKLGIVARALAWAGGCLLTITLTSLLRDALGPVVGTAALLGGLTLQGSNRTTRDQILAELRVHEIQRADLIDALSAVVVYDAGP